ncbi:MAG: phosphatase PAP2 family protein [Nitratireductor sp.]|nr:phosphatase PAP2 family protein [Nitratireductor sp.]
MSWFAFVNGRRRDYRSSIVSWNTFALVGFAAVIAVKGLIFFADGRYLEALRGGAWRDNRFFETITYLGLSDWILIGSGAALLALSLVAANRLDRALHTVWQRLVLSFYFVFTAVALPGLIVSAVKFAIGRARPKEVVGAFPWEWHPFAGGYDFASFPSGHATTAGAFCVALAFLFPRYRYPLLVAGLLVAASRCVLGVHFPSDVLAGFSSGAGFAWIWARAFARKRLLFTFSDGGRLALRGEGRGHLHRWPELFGLISRS